MISKQDPATYKKVNGDNLYDDILLLLNPKSMVKHGSDFRYKHSFHSILDDLFKQTPSKIETTNKPRPPKPNTTMMTPPKPRIKPTISNFEEVD